MFAQRIQSRLAEQKRSGLYRNPPQIDKRAGKYLTVNGGQVLNFASNDYLGLAASEELRQQVADNFTKYSPSSSSSRLVSGNYSIIAEAEQAYADYFGYESAIFFPSGYQANVGLISTLFEDGDAVFFDKHVHASSVKGLSLSGANLMGYRHNSMKHLAKRLNTKGERPAAVVTESLFSMDGDLLKKDELAALKKREELFVIVDEAHSVGVLGEKGRGYAREVADIALGTFGKALGLFGAFVLLPKEFKQYLFNFASSLIYTTTLPEAHAASTLAVLSQLEKGDEKREQLAAISTYTKESLREKGFLVHGDAQIVSIEIGEESKTVELAQKLLSSGYFVLPARFPTVPRGKAILRLGMTVLHNKEDVDGFVQTLLKLGL